MRPRSHEFSQPTNNRLRIATIAGVIGTTLFTGCSSPGPNEFDSVTLYVSCEEPGSDVIAVANPDRTAPMASLFDPNVSEYNDVYMQCVSPAGSTTYAFVSVAEDFKGTLHDPTKSPSDRQPDKTVTVIYLPGDGPDRLTPQKFVGGRGDNSWATASKEDGFAVDRIRFEGVQLTPDNTHVAPYQQ